MDLRDYFKGDSPAGEEKKEPKKSVFELPELFLSSVQGVGGQQRSRSNTVEHVEDESSDIYDYNHDGRRVLSPLEVRVHQTQATRKRRIKGTVDLSFTDDLDEHLHLVSPVHNHKEKVSLIQPDSTKKGKYSALPTDEHQRKAHSINSTTTLSKDRSLTSPPSSIHTNTKLLPSSSTQSSSTSTTTTPPRKPTHSTSKLSTSSTSTATATSTSTSTTTTTRHPPPSKSVSVDDHELEGKIQDKMEAVQMWQTKCNELRKQLAHATAQLTQSLDELDELNSLYESNQ